MVLTMCALHNILRTHSSHEELIISEIDTDNKSDDGDNDSLELTAGETMELFERFMNA